MTITHLSPVTLPASSPLRRESPRPPELRNERYADQFDADTLFYDVYRVGRDVVFQGPPLLNLGAAVAEAALFRGRRHLVLPRARRIERNRASEVWLRTDADALTFDLPLGNGRSHRFDIRVQPNESARFAGRRVLHTLSKNNEVRWIIDWIRYYQKVHGADAVLFYDNGSHRYGAAELERELGATFPDMEIAVVDWPFRYGPQGGLAGAVNGVEAPWDSDYCQTGSMQHARFRYLRDARSVLNVDIDELVVGPEPIFAATERARGRFIKFAGQWITSATARGVTAADCRHADFTLRDRQETETCPPKWCVVPAACSDTRHCWSVHNLFGSRANRRVSSDFSYRHLKGISNNWKYDRWDGEPFDPARYDEDTALVATLANAGLTRSTEPGR